MYWLWGTPGYSGPLAFCTARMQNWNRSVALGNHIVLLPLGISGDISTPQPHSCASVKDDSAELLISGTTLRLPSYTGIYHRLIAPTAIDDEDPHYDRKLEKYIALWNALFATRITVVNPPVTGWENSSKPLQTAMLGQFGFRVPAFLSTNVEEDFRLFTEQTDTIYKSNSAVRSIVNLTKNKKQIGFGHLAPSPRSGLEG